MKQQILDSSHYFSLGRTDFFSPYILKLVFLPLLFSILFWGAIFYFFGGVAFDWLYSFVDLDFSFSLKILLWIQSGLNFIIKLSLIALFVVAFYVFVMLSNLAFCGFLTPFVVSYVHKTHYEANPLFDDFGIVHILFFLLKTYLLYFLFLLLLLPFYFIPFLGALLILFLNYWLFYKTLAMDAGERIFTKEKFRGALMLYKNKIRGVVLPLYGLSLIPILNFFIPFYALIVLVHLFFYLQSKELANADSN